MSRFVEWLSTATLNATEAAKLFATEKNLPVYGVFPLPLTAVPAAAWVIWQNAFQASPNWRAFAESADFGLKLCPVANNVARRDREVSTARWTISRVTKNSVVRLCVSSWKMERGMNAQLYMLRDVM